MSQEKTDEKMSEFEQLVRDRYEPEGEMEHELEVSMFFLINAADQYEVEPQMLEYAKEHPQATLKELINYFEAITPNELPPCASEWDDEDDDWD